jgi:hypothetical protein
MQLLHRHLIFFLFLYPFVSDQYDVCISNSNYNDCLPSIGKNASCFPNTEVTVIPKHGQPKLCPPSESIITCPKYHDPACNRSITIDSILIQSCSYISRTTEDSPLKLSDVVVNLRDRASAECLEILDNKCTSVTVIESVTFLHHSQSQGITE